MTETLLTTLPASCPVLVGRTGVLRLLDESLDAAATGKGKVLVLSGEAGIGKSRLAAEARARAGGRGFSVLRAGCFEPDKLLPYAPLLDLLAAAGQLAGEPAGSAGRMTPEL